MQGVLAGNQSLKEGVQGTREAMESGVLGKEAEVAGRAPVNFGRAFGLANKTKGVLEAAATGGGGGTLVGFCMLVRIPDGL